MIRITKNFHFEMAHAIYGYNGACKNIHGHSYQLQVTVSDGKQHIVPIEGTGIMIDFKVIKKIVQQAVIEKMDHHLCLSTHFLKAHPAFPKQDNLLIWDFEPTAENMLIYIAQTIKSLLPAEIQLIHLKLYETPDSFAEWLA